MVSICVMLDFVFLTGHCNVVARMLVSSEMSRSSHWIVAFEKTEDAIAAVDELDLTVKCFLDNCWRINIIYNVL